MSYSLIQIEVFPFAVIGALASIRWCWRKVKQFATWRARVGNAINNSSDALNYTQNLWNAMREVQHRLDKLENERKHKP